MKRQTTWALQLLITSVSLLILNSCVKDNCRQTYTIYKPIYKSLSQVRAEMKSGAPEEVKQTGKLFMYGNYIFLNEPDKGVHIIDNSNPAEMKNISFVKIPGNVDMAVSGSTMYADSYSDLAVFDISNPRNVKAVKFVSDIFPQRAYYYSNYGKKDPDSIMLVADWLTKDTTVDCEQYNYLYGNFYSTFASDASGNFMSKDIGGGGKGGSMARFTIQREHLYAVTYSDLNVVNVAAPQDPKFIAKTHIGNWNIETIYPFRDKLFIGSSDGMYIYDVSSPGSPVKQSQFTHARACDPVVADDNYAWVTLRSGTACQGFANQLDVVNISNITAPSLLTTYNLTNPHGLSKDGNLLFICDGKDGLKIYDASNANALKQLKHITGLDTYDVIAWNGKALVVAKDGLYQFDYSELTNIRLLSKIGLNK